MKVKVKVTMTMENADEDSVEKQGNKARRMTIRVTMTLVCGNQGGDDDDRY